MGAATVTSGKVSSELQATGQQGQLLLATFRRAMHLEWHAARQAAGGEGSQVDRHPKSDGHGLVRTYRRPKEPEHVTHVEEHELGQYATDVLRPRSAVAHSRRALTC